MNLQFTSSVRNIEKTINVQSRNLSFKISISDLGSNIGVFTLASLTMGNKVISVDPSPQNHAILYNSLGIVGR